MADFNISLDDSGKKMNMCQLVCQRGQSYISVFAEGWIQKRRSPSLTLTLEKKIFIYSLYTKLSFLNFHILESVYRQCMENVVNA